MNVRFHHDPWDAETQAEFISGMGAVLAAYLREGKSDHAEAPPTEGTKKRSRRRTDRAGGKTDNEVRHG